MKLSLFAPLALVALTASLESTAAETTHLLPNYGLPAASSAQQPKVAGSTATVGTPMANANRAYPPSCASYPLPDKPSGPTYSGAAVGLAPYISTYDVTFYSTEALTATVWRVPCSSSGNPVPYNSAGAKNAMTLVRIDRADDTVATNVPMVPLVLVLQGSVTSSNADAKTNVRLATEPNTVSSDTPYGNLYNLFTTSTTYVLENRSSANAVHFNFNDAFTLQMRTGYATVEIPVAAYAPTTDTYPDAFNPMPLDGYAAAQWYNADRNEGLILQVAEGYDGANPKRRQVVFDLLTEDSAGNPFWIVGNAAFDPVAGGVRSIDVPVSYLVENNEQQGWGTAHLVMTDCSHMNVTFTPKADLPESVPSISGPITYDRLLSANGMVCE